MRISLRSLVFSCMLTGLVLGIVLRYSKWELVWAGRYSLSLIRFFDFKEDGMLGAAYGESKLSIFDVTSKEIIQEKTFPENTFAVDLDISVRSGIALLLLKTPMERTWVKGSIKYGESKAYVYIIDLKNIDMMADATGKLDEILGGSGKAKFVECVRFDSEGREMFVRLSEEPAGKTFVCSIDERLLPKLREVRAGDFECPKNSIVKLDAEKFMFVPCWEDAHYTPGLYRKYPAGMIWGLAALPEFWIGSILLAYVLLLLVKKYAYSVPTQLPSTTAHYERAEEKAQQSESPQPPPAPK